MILLLAFAFLSGLVTILAPCIWPLLPIILSSSISGTDHKRPLGITLGIIISFAVFTLTVSWLVMLFHFDPDILRFFAVIVIGFLGFTMVIPPLSSITETVVSKISFLFGKTTLSLEKGFFGGFVTGLSLGIVWSPCAGPILASIAALSTTGRVNGSLVAITTAYVIGVGIPLFFFSYAGQQIITKTRFISKYTGRIQQVFGVLMILTALAIYTNYDKVIQVKLLNLFPRYSEVLTQFENQKDVQKQLDILKGSARKNSNSASFGSSDLFNTNTPVPEFVGITKWLNSSRFTGEADTDHPLTMSELKGKVVLVDFWTYTCINCIRTLPFVTSWYEKYKDKGFIVIGVHTPEFEFEKKTENVENAIKQYAIHYPVAQDNEYGTWNAFDNHYWPAEYLIDSNGIIRRTHFGEGKYDETEMAIKALLKEAGSQVGKEIIDMPDQTPRQQFTPETYLGSSRMDRSLFSKNNTGEYKINRPLPEHYFGFEGKWGLSGESATAKKGAVLEFNFYANKVFLVITPKSKDDTITVLLDGKKVDEKTAGIDVLDSKIKLDTERLYNLIDLKGQSGNHLLRLEFQADGTSVYAFTFG